MEETIDREGMEKARADESRLLDALERLEKSAEWSVLRELVFDPALERIDRLLLSEAKREKIDEKRICRLQGEMSWAARYCDLKSFADSHKSLLEALNNKLK